jgi:4-amino-4-deoxychorismate lyase
MMQWIVNGKLATSVPVEDRGFAYGDGLFETIAIRAGEPRFLEQHLGRLVAGCRKLEIEVPDLGGVAHDISRVSAARAAGTVKIVVSRGPGRRGYAPTSDGKPTVAIGFDASERPGKDIAHSEPWKLIRCGIRASVNPDLAGLKTLNRLDNVMARMECLRRGADEGLMCTADGRIIGGTMSNLFIVNGDRLITPALDMAGVRGVMRGVVMQVAERLGIALDEDVIDVHSVAGADEMFMTNSLIGVHSAFLAGNIYKGRGPIEQMLRAEMTALGVTECRQ